MNRPIFGCAVKYSITILFLWFCAGAVEGQSFSFGPKGGLTIAIQNWNSSDRDPLFGSHAAIFIESADKELKGALFAEAGYHLRGSSIRIVNFFQGINFTDGYKFRNVALKLGAKKRLDTSLNSIPFYAFAIRGEYNINTNLKDFEQYQSLFYPIEFYVNTFVYGVDVSGGFEFPVSDYVIPFIQFTISPDLSFQYRQPALSNILSPYNGQTITVPERQIRNISFEVSFGIRFFREVVVLD